MQKFELTPDMLTMGGVFYPKGYAFVMFASQADAQRVATAVDGTNEQADPAMLLSPQDVLRQVGRLDGQSDLALPSVGTEGATVNRYLALARDEHWAVMVRVRHEDDAEALMVHARQGPYAYAQRYHLLAIEDLV